MPAATWTVLIHLILMFILMSRAALDCSTTQDLGESVECLIIIGFPCQDQPLTNPGDLALHVMHVSSLIGAHCHHMFVSMVTGLHSVMVKFTL